MPCTFQIDLVLSFEELLESLGCRHRFAIKSKECYPNVPATLLPQCCKRGSTDDILVDEAEIESDLGRPAKVRKWIAKWYSKLWITDEYSTSGVNISEAIKPPPVSTSVVMLRTQSSSHGSGCPKVDAL